MNTDVHQFISDLDGGVFEQKLAEILSEVAGSVVDHGKQGAIEIKLKIDRIGSGYQVAVKHTLSFTRPTSRGKASEDNTTTTPMHIGQGGSMTFFPDTQQSIFNNSHDNRSHTEGNKS